MTAKSKINEQGIRVDATTGTPIQQSTKSQVDNLNLSLNVTNPPNRVNPINPITPQDLTGSATPATVTPPRQSTAAQDLLAAIPSPFVQDLQDKSQESERGLRSSAKSYFDFLMNQEGEIEATTKAEEEAGLPALEKQKREVDKQLLDEQIRLRREVERIEDNQAGLFGGAVEDKIQEANNKSYRAQADLAITKLAIDGDYQGAKAIADRAVAIQMERQKNYTEALKFNFELNKELFDKDEERAFNAMINERERALDKEEKNLQSISDLSLNALKNGAPTTLASQMRQAKTVEDAMEIGGQYVDRYARLMDEATMANIYDQIRARNQAIDEAKSNGLSGKEAEQDEIKAETEAALNNLGFIDTLKTHPGLKGAVGAGRMKAIRGLANAIPFISVNTEGAIAGSEKANFIKAHEQFKNSLTLENLDLMSGVLSETDIQILSSAATKLDLSLSEKEYMEEVEKIEDRFLRAINLNGLTEEQAEFFFGISPEDIESVNLIYGESNSTPAFNPANYY